MFVCTIKPKRLKVQSPNFPSRVLAHQLILGQKVEGQGHNMQKHIEGDQVAYMSYVLYWVPGL